MAPSGKMLPVAPQTAARQSASTWQASLAKAIRAPEELLIRLGLPDSLQAAARRASLQFPVMVPESYLQRMTSGDPADPLLRQVLPLEDETEVLAGYGEDAVGDRSARRAPGLLQKYAGRALLITTGACAVHCRYCFRRHYSYQQEPRRLEEWDPALTEISRDSSLQEVILSGGDPLMLTDHRLGQLIARLADVGHVRRLRIHSRLPVVLPDRVTDSLIDVISRHDHLQPLMVIHANHARELVADCAEACLKLVRSGIPTLNQAVLLRGVNDSEEALCELSERLVNLGVMPYYLHQLDRVQGAAHFEVSDSKAVQLLETVRRRLPGYAVPQLVREVAGEPYKVPLGALLFGDNRDS